MLPVRAEGPTGSSALAFKAPPAGMQDGMGLFDKLLGRTKKATGDMLGDPTLHAEGEHRERSGDAADRAEQHEQAAVEARREAADERSQEQQH